MPNALTRYVGLNAGTWALETLVKHYFEQLFDDKNGGREANTAVASGNLRRDEILYDEAFHIVKSFLDASTHHTVEELQEFSNVRTPSSPWMHVVRVDVPMTCCDEAAAVLIDALGGEEKTRQVVGGTKWWQVRGIRGVDAQWIVARKDYHQARKRRKQHEQAKRERRETTEESDEDDQKYSPDMDEMRCILYFHGGGYYFGSVDQERYFIQRFARKSGCRLLAINYRLAPQYPFPCAIQDAIAAYLYLIRPPPDALHTPVNPAHIVISGDSAGGGLSLALLQVIRDTGLPPPAGGILISPWCDMTHSFPSIHLNTETDVIPKYGLSMHKPSALWPPPPDEMTSHVQASLRKRIKQLARQYYDGRDGQDGHNSHTGPSAKDEESDSPTHSSFWRRKLSFGHHRKHGRRERSGSRGRGRARSESPMPSHTLADDAETGDVRSAAVSRSQSGKRDKSRGGTDEGRQSVELGATTPLPTADSTGSQTISMLTESGETIVVDDQVQLYAENNLLGHPLVSPALSYLGGLPPLQVIASDAEVLRDEVIYSAHKAAHPERYAVMPEARNLYPKLEGIESRYGPTKVHLQVYDQTAHVLPVLFSFCTPAKFCFRAMAIFCKYVTGTLTPPSLDATNGAPSTPASPRLSVRRALSLSVPRRASSLMGKRRVTQPTGNIPPGVDGTESPPRGSSESGSRSEPVKADPLMPAVDSVQYAGNPMVYLRSFDDPSTSPFTDNMIRERISTRGVIRALEPEGELDGCILPAERVGVVAELAIRRYVEGRRKWDERYARTIKNIRKQRARNLDIAKSDTVRNVSQLQMHFFQNAQESGPRENMHGAPLMDVKEGLRKSAASWAWAWAIDGEERPPPSSIVSRRDTEEARRLSKIADQPTTENDRRMSGNNLWSFLVNSLSLEKAHVDHAAAKADVSRTGGTSSSDMNTPPGKIAKIRRFMSVSAGTSRCIGIPPSPGDGPSDRTELDRVKSH